MADESADHDRLFKDLLKTFFFEFIELFMPAVAAYLRPGHVEFLEQEIFTDIASRERHEVDLLAKVKFRDADAFFLIHVENQASAQTDFAKRMFRYFARLHEKFDLPVYPVALPSFDAPLRAEPELYRIEFPDKKVLEFSFRAIQLNRLNWRQFIDHPNPVAAALMAKMRMAPDDRPRLKLEILRMIVRLRLDPARSALIGNFVARYLHLNPVDYAAYNRQLHQASAGEQEAIVQIVDEWEASGMRRAIFKMLRSFFGELPADVLDRVDQLSLVQLEELIDAFPSFRGVAELDAWLRQQS